MFKKVLLNLSIEFGPIIVFSIISEKMNFITATAIFVGLTFVALVAGFIERRKIAWFPLIVAGSVITFGVLTVIFENPFFIIFKDTLYNSAFAIVLFIGVAKKKGLLKKLFDGLFSMTDKGWLVLSYRWAIMFTLLAISNEIARANLTPAQWVNFKVLATVTTAVFSLYQFRLSRKERLPESTAWGMSINSRI